MAVEVYVLDAYSSAEAKRLGKYSEEKYYLQNVLGRHLPEVV